MNKIDIIISIIAFIVLSISLFIINGLKASRILKNKKKRKNKDFEITEVKYLMATYNLKKEKLLTPKIIGIISVIDAFIISIVFLLVITLPWKIYWQLLLGFALLIGLIYSLYGILGKILEKRGYKNERN